MKKKIYELNPRKSKQADFDDNINPATLAL